MAERDLSITDPYYIQLAQADARRLNLQYAGVIGIQPDVNGAPYAVLWNDTGRSTHSVVMPREHREPAPQVVSSSGPLAFFTQNTPVRMRLSKKAAWENGIISNIDFSREQVFIKDSSGLECQFNFAEFSSLVEKIG